MQADADEADCDAIAVMTVAVVVLLFLFRGVSRIFSESFRLFGFFAFRSCGAAIWALWLFGLQGLNLTTELHVEASSPTNSKYCEELPTRLASIQQT